MSANVIPRPAIDVYNTTQTGLAASGDSGSLAVASLIELMCLCNLTALTGTSVQFNLQAQDVQGNWYSINTGTALVAASTSVLSTGAGLNNKGFGNAVRLQWILVAASAVNFTVDIIGKYQ